MDQPSITPFTASSRRRSSISTTATPSAALSSLRSYRVPVNKWAKTSSIFALGDSLEAEVDKQILGEKRFIEASKLALENKLKLIRERIPEEERQKFDDWVHKFEKEVETPQNPNWNYTCPDNHQRICQTIQNFWRPSHAAYFVHLYAAPVDELVNNMNLESIVEYRKEDLLEDLTKFVNRAHRIHNADAGMVKNWARSLIRTLETMYDQHYYNYQDQHNWRRISAVTNYMACYDKNHPPPYACIVEGDHIVSVLQIENLIEQIKLRAPAL